MKDTRTFPILCYIPFTDNNYKAVTDLAYINGNSICGTIADLIEVGLLQIQSIQPDIVVDSTGGFKDVI